MIWMLFVNIASERTMDETVENQLIRTLLCSIVSISCLAHPFDLQLWALFTRRWY